MEHDGQNFLSFWTVFCPFTPTTQKMKIQHGDIILHLCIHHKWHSHICMWGIAHEIWSVTKRIFCHFVTALLLPWKTWKNQNFEKMKKKSWRYISSFNTNVPKIMIIYARPFLRYDAYPHKKTSQDLTEN